MILALLSVQRCPPQANRRRATLAQERDIAVTHSIRENPAMSRYNKSRKFPTMPRIEGLYPLSSTP